MKQKIIISKRITKVIPYSGNEPESIYEATELEGKDAYWFDFDREGITHHEYNAKKHEWTHTEEDLGVLH